MDTANDLIEFLTARLDADEAIALAAIDDDGDDTGLEGMFVNLTTPGATPWLRGALGDEFAAMLAHFVVPARVLREVEAKRAIVEDYLDALRCAPTDMSAEVGRVALLCPLHALAAVYSDHPDYNPKWAV